MVSDLVEVITALKEPALAHARVAILGHLVTFPIAGHTVLTLSPSLADTQDQLAALATYLPGWRGRKPRRYDVNSGCAVMRLSCGSFNVMLSSDLDIGDDDYRGWRSIVKNHGPSIASQILKVGHHGSDTAFHLPALTAIQSTVTDGAVTPFPARGEHLPRASMLRQYKRVLRTVHVTASKAAANHAGKVQIKNTPFSSYVKLGPSSLDAVGQVRYRVDLATATVRTELFGGATRA